MTACCVFVAQSLEFKCKLFFVILIRNAFIYVDLLSGVRREADDGRLPQTVAQRMEELYRNYRNAVN